VFKGIVWSMLLFNMVIFIICVFMFGLPGNTQITLNEEGIEMNFQVDFTSLLISIVIMGILIALLGINVFGSGLGTESVALITHMLKGFIVWTVFSVYTGSLFALMPYGAFMWNIITIIFASCLFMSYNERSGVE